MVVVPFLRNNPSAIMFLINKKKTKEEEAENRY
jgi:hypothetical protein